MIPSPDLTIYRYNVVVQANTTGKTLSQIIRLLLELPGYGEFQDDVVTDFKSTLVSKRRLNPDVAELAIQYRAEVEDEPRANSQTYQLRVKETGTLTVSEPTDYLTSTNVHATYADNLPVLQALNIFLGSCAKSSAAVAMDGSGKSFSLSQAFPKWDRPWNRVVRSSRMSESRPVASSSTSTTFMKPFRMPYR